MQRVLGQKVANASVKPNMSVNASNGITGMNGMKQGVKKADTTIIIIMIAVFLLFIAVILYIMFRLKGSKLLLKELVSDPVKLDEISSAKIIESSEIPKPVVGVEYGYSFWIYVDSTAYTPITTGTTPQDKLIFFRSGDTNVNSANTLVFMDGVSNSLYIALQTGGATLTDTNNVVYNSNLYNIRKMNYFLNNNLLLNKSTDPDTAAINKYIILTIDYVPLQRWVHVSFVIDNNIVTIYLDGEIYSVKSLSEFKAMRTPEVDSSNKPIPLTLTFNTPDGNIYYGKNTNLTNGGNPPSSYFSKLVFYNYAVSSSEIRKIYSKGPLSKSFMSSLGLNYGVRSPIYKLDSIDE